MPERDPNPVTAIIVTRGAQVGGAALLALLGLRAALPPERFRPLVPWSGALVTAGLSAYFAATFSAALPLGPPVLARLPDEAGEAVALTFDDGPHPETTPRLLAVLAAHGAKATFFVLGASVSRYPELVRRIHAEGHTLGIHALRHRTMVLQSARAIEADLRETRQRLAAVLPDAAPVRLFRPPYGFKTVTLARVAARLGLTLVAWSLDPRDYDPVTAEMLLARAARRLRARAIVLLHERPDSAATLDALPELLRLCAARGLRCIALNP